MIMADWHSVLTTEQKETVIGLAELRKNDSSFERKHIRETYSLTNKSHDRLMEFLHLESHAEPSGILNEDRWESYFIRPSIEVVANDLENPPARNYPAEKLAWFNAQPWSWWVVLVGAAVSFVGGAVSLYKLVAELLQ